MKHHATHLVPIILTFGLCIASLNTNAATTNPGYQTVLYAPALATLNQNSESGFLNFNTQSNFGSEGNLHLATGVTNFSIDNQPRLLTDFTGKTGRPILEANIGHENFDFERAGIVASAVPETSEYILLLCGLIFLLGIAKRRNFDLGFTAV
jgi:hypothetical protein